jgi:hypothetical protein
MEFQMDMICHHSQTLPKRDDKNHPLWQICLLGIIELTWLSARITPTTIRNTENFLIKTVVDTNIQINSNTFIKLHQMANETSHSSIRSPNTTGKRDLQFHLDHNKKHCKILWKTGSKPTSWWCIPKIITIDQKTKESILTNLWTISTKASCLVQNISCH